MNRNEIIQSSVFTFRCHQSLVMLPDFNLCLGGGQDLYVAPLEARNAPGQNQRMVLSKILKEGDGCLDIFCFEGLGVVLPSASPLHSRSHPLLLQVFNERREKILADTETISKRKSIEYKFIKKCNTRD